MMYLNISTKNVRRQRESCSSHLVIVLVTQNMEYENRQFCNLKRNLIFKCAYKYVQRMCFLTQIFHVYIVHLYTLSISRAFQRERYLHVWCPMTSSKECIISHNILYFRETNLFYENLPHFNELIQFEFISIKKE